MPPVRIQADQGTGPRQRRRVDARRNHDSVLGAASEMFAARGWKATIPQIAARAGVGKATVYRSYPTKAALFAAVAQRELAWFEQRAGEAAQAPDPGQALFDLVRDLLVRLSRQRTLGHLLRTEPVVGAKDSAERIVAGLGRTFQRAQQAGAVRPEVTVADLQALIGGSARQLAAYGAEDREQWQRLATLICRAIAP